jgi:putative ABC transport system permease protein
MIARLVRRIVHGWRSRHEEAALREELEFHHAMKQQELERDGMTRNEARFAARRRIGNTTRAREDARAVWIWPWLDGLRQDTSYAARSLRRQPGFTLMSLAVLGVAIGLNVSLFTVFAGLAIRPMAGMRDAASIVTVAALNPPRLGGVSGLSFPEYAFLADHSKSFAGLAAVVPTGVRLEVGRSLQTMTAYLATANYFDVLGVSMEQGRGFLAGDDRRGSPQRVAVLSHALWSARFAADPGVIGREVRIEGTPFTVIGIASRSFVGPAGSSSRIWLPISAAPVIRPNDPFVSTLVERADSCCVTVTGRRAPSVSNAQAQAEAQVLSRRFRETVQQPDRPIVLNGTQFLAGRSAASKVLAILGVLGFGMLLVLLIACANVGNLLLARGAARAGEIGVRLSLGAERLRVVRQLMTEGLVLAIAASAVGALVSMWLPPMVLQRLAGEALPFDVTTDRWVIAYALALAVVSCVAFALAPALHATRSDIARALRNDAPALPSRFPLRSSLLAVQVAVTVVLLTSAGLLFRGVVQARLLDPGFRIDHVATARIDLPDDALSASRARDLTAALTSGLEQASIGPFGLTSFEPLPGAHTSIAVRKAGDSPDRRMQIDALTVSGGYFAVLEIPLLAGRTFTAADTGRRVAVVNETLARRVWPDGSGIGQSLLMFLGEGGEVSIDVVGVARDAHLVTMDSLAPMVFLPPADRPLTRVVFQTVDASTIAKVSAIVRRIDANARVDITPVEDRLDAWLGEITLAPIAASVLGVFGLVVAVVGMIGVFSYAVRQRTREIGIRVALGASGRDVIRLVLASSSRAVLVGLGAGAIGAIAASQILRRALYGLSPFDPVAYGSVVVLLAAAALAASYLPARRALKIDPVTALRYD